MQGGDGYQSAYYVFDETSTLPGSRNVNILNGKAIAQAAMGHLPEAEAALAESTEMVLPRLSPAVSLARLTCFL
jgi:coatomer protein complex subunit epsilon